MAVLALGFAVAGAMRLMGWIKAKPQRELQKRNHKRSQPGILAEKQRERVQHFYALLGALIIFPILSFVFVFPHVLAFAGGWYPYGRAILIGGWIAGTLYFGVLMAKGVTPSPDGRFFPHLDGRSAKLASICIAVLLAFAAMSVSQAELYHNHNCWKIRDGVEHRIWECVPGRSTPPEQNISDTSGGNYNSCTQTSTSSSGGTIWECDSLSV